MRNTRKVHLVYLFTFDVKHTLKTELGLFFCLSFDTTLISDEFNSPAIKTLGYLRFSKNLKVQSCIMKIFAYILLNALNQNERHELPTITCVIIYTMAVSHFFRLAQVECSFYILPENIRNPKVFQKFSRGIETQHQPEMNNFSDLNKTVNSFMMEIPIIQKPIL